MSIRQPQAAPMHMQPPPSVSREELARIGVGMLSPLIVRGMVGSPQCAIVDLRDDDFYGGHIPGCVHITAYELRGNIDGAIARFQHVPTVIFHCLISMHRAPLCAKMYKERLMQMGRHQEVAVLEGGFTAWRDLFSGNPQLIEGETLDSDGAQQQYALGFGLGQQFVDSVRNNGHGTVGMSQQPVGLQSLGSFNYSQENIGGPVDFGNSPLYGSVGIGSFKYGQQLVGQQPAGFYNYSQQPVSSFNYSSSPIVGPSSYMYGAVGSGYVAAPLAPSSYVGTTSVVAGSLNYVGSPTYGSICPSSLPYSCNPAFVRSF